LIAWGCGDRAANHFSGLLIPKKYRTMEGNLMNEKEIQAAITLRLHAFHDALVERGQIKAHSRISLPEAGGTELVGVEGVQANHCTEEQIA
jgi:hypothetical protein